MSMAMLWVSNTAVLWVNSRLSEVWSWPSWTWVRTGLTPRVQVSGPVRSGPAPDFVGPGPGGEWTGPWGRTGVGPGLNLYFKFIVLCTVSNIILSFCNCFQEGQTRWSLKLFMHHCNESTTPIAGLSSLSLPYTTHFCKFLFHLFLCNKLLILVLVPFLWQQRQMMDTMGWWWVLLFLNFEFLLTNFLFII